ncbi:SDR family oxidoreductase [Kitasatospora sp. NPDC088351]|uniref:SDR family NAD(P)-dependent oxidoreductase n=1 Tax=unclassified Kitasatospora TaxID=2633591 RepID=UPI00343309C2
MESPRTGDSWPRHPDLDGKVALVTGGSRGIGATTCRALAANGVKVAVNGRDETAIEAVVRSITEDGGHAVPAPGDVTEPDTAGRLRAVIERELGPVDILAPFAGGQGRPVPTARLTPDVWNAAIASDLTSVYLTVSAFLPAMIERRSGTVVMMSSTAGRHPGGSNAAYAAAKAGVLMFARHLANEVGRHGVRVNCLAPSAVLNERMRQSMSDEQLTGLAGMFPLGRLGRPEDVAQAVLYLASDAASWVTGATLDLSGGRVIA